MFKSILVGHKSFCYLQSQSQSFSLDNGFREQRELVSICNSQATVTKVKWLMFVFSITFILLELKKPTLIMNSGHAVAQLVWALRYKPEGRGFDSRWCHWIFSLT
jgi:hypothetical protein